MTVMFEPVVTFFTHLFSYGGDFLVSWCMDLIPAIFMVLILTNALIRMIPSRFIEKAAVLASQHLLLKYMLIPFFGALLLGNPSALTLGRFMPEKDKPSYYACASFFCHTSSGIFPHINPSELFIWLGIARGVETLGYPLYPLAFRYLAAGLLANFLCGIATDRTTAYYSRKMQLTLADTPEFSESPHVRPAEKETESAFHEIRITAGRSGYGGPLTVKPGGSRTKLVYVTGGGIRPDVVDRIEQLTGCTCINGFSSSVPDEEIFLAVIDCGGTLRCGIYPKKGIPTVNLLPTGKSGPLARYITEDLYVSDVSADCIYSTEDQTAAQKKQESDLPARLSRLWTGFLSTVGKGCCLFYKASQDSLHTILHTLLPLMGFVSLLTAAVECSGLNAWIAGRLTFLSSGILGLLLLSIIISFPVLSPVLAPGAIIAQVTGTLIGTQIGCGAIPAALALPALFAVNTQAACDFVPVGLGLAQAKEDTIKVGVPSVLTSRFLTSILRVLTAWLFSLGLYA